jgi:alpha-glucosidase
VTPDVEQAVPWWRRAVVYQVYPRSFQDSDGDGIGDLEGIRSRIPYLVSLGVDAIWICPWYESPLADGGYDVADYRRIDARLGTLDGAERLIQSCHEAGIRVIVDLVPNHTSEEHPWFREALADAPGGSARRRYIFRPSAGDGGPPNNWTSVFGGPAWRHTADGEWYLHLFSPQQPDLNWDEEEVRAEFDAIFRFWLDRGVDGFRIDVAHGLVKAEGLPDVGETEGILATEHVHDHPYWDRPGIHAINRRWRSLLDAAGDHTMMVAEAWIRPERIPDYVRSDQYHQSFNFDLLTTEWAAAPMRLAIDRALDAAASAGSAPTWTIANHDFMRPATRYGLPSAVDPRTWPVTGPFSALDEELGLRRARAATLLLLALPGSTYLYQGEELALPEAWDLPDEALTDPVWISSGGTRRGRDGCRVPLPWSSEAPGYGFTTGRPWLPIPEGFGALAVDRQLASPTSTLNLVRAALALRRNALDADEHLEWLDLGPTALAFRRGNGAICVTNLGSTPVALPLGSIMIGTTGIQGGELPPDSTVWLAPPDDDPTTRDRGRSRDD